MKTGARWILRVKEGRKLTQSCIEELLGDVTDMCSYTVSQLGTQVSSLLRDAGIKMDDIPGLNELFQPGSSYCQPFCQLETQHRQLAFYTSHFNYVVSSLLWLWWQNRSIYCPLVYIYIHDYIYAHHAS